MCHASTVRFNQEASRLDPGVEILIISMDLPFAQGRWCSATGVRDVKTFSDHRDGSFGAVLRCVDEGFASVGPGGFCR